MYMCVGYLFGEVLKLNFVRESILSVPKANELKKIWKVIWLCDMMILKYIYNIPIVYFFFNC